MKSDVAKGQQLRVAAAGGALLVSAVLAQRIVTQRSAQVATTPQSAGPAVPSTSTPAVPRPSGSTPSLVDRCEAAILREVPARRLSPVATRTLAIQLVTVCAEEGYPLDLAFGHAYAESSLQLTAVNPSSKATGPLQVTPIAAQQVGAAWPMTTPAAQIRAGLRYMKWLRSAYPACRSSVRETLRHYGMGPGNWEKYKRGELTCSTPLSVARAELGCPGARPYSATVLAIAQRYPELKTTAWWGS